MPYAPKHVCAYTGCHNLVSNPSQGYCDEHNQAVNHRYNKERTDTLEREFYGQQRWKVARAAYLLDHPYCERHLEQGKFVPAVMVHHKKAVKDYPDLALEPTNFESLCDACHNADHPDKGGRHD
jgi:5-methylcytosine-specific restriction protein A